MLKDIKLLRFNFTSISIDRKDSNNFKLTSNIKINSITKEEVAKINKKALKISFDFGLDYGDAGNILIKGFILLSLDEKEIESIVKQWADKKLSNEINILISNLIFQKCSLRAIQLEEEFNFPTHFNLPRFGVTKKSEN